MACNICDFIDQRDGVCDNCVGSGRAEAMERGAPTSAPRNDVAKASASPGMWQPEVQVTEGGPWTTKIPSGYGRPLTRKDTSAPKGYRVFGIFVDAGNLRTFPIYYVDDKHAGMGPITSSHGVWSLDFFPADGNGIVVNDDDQGIHGRPYRLRFRKTSDSLSADAS